MILDNSPYISSPISLCKLLSTKPNPTSLYLSLILKLPTHKSKTSQTILIKMPPPRIILNNMNEASSFRGKKKMLWVIALNNCMRGICQGLITPSLLWTTASVIFT